MVHFTELKKSAKHLPLEIIGPRVFMLLVWTEWTYVSGGVMDKPVANHLILPFEPLPPRTTWATFNWAEVRSILRVDIRM